MQHQRTNRKLGMKTEHRLSMLRNMATSLIEHGRVRTTITRAKEVRRVVEKMITLGKRGDLNARRAAARILRGNATLQKLFNEIAPRYKQRAGGYTRIVKVGRRLGDNAPMAVIELVEAEMRKPIKKKRTVKKPATRPESGATSEAKE